MNTHIVPMLCMFEMKPLLCFGLPILYRQLQLGGALWDIFARGADALMLSTWLQQNAAGFTHMDEPLSPAYPTFAEPYGPIHSQLFMLHQGHREALAADTGDGYAPCFASCW